MAGIHYNRALSQRGLNRQISVTAALTPEGDRFYYFTCGPEMLQEHLKSICPSAKFVSVGCLDGYKLVFKGRSQVWNASIATPKSYDEEEEEEEEEEGEEEEGGSGEEEYRILGVVWTILQSELYLLDTHDAGWSVVKSVDVTTRGQSRLKCRMYEAAEGLPNLQETKDTSGQDKLQTSTEKSSSGGKEKNNDSNNNNDSICSDEKNGENFGNTSIDSGLSSLALTEENLSLHSTASVLESLHIQEAHHISTDAGKTTEQVHLGTETVPSTAPSGKSLPSDVYMSLCIAGGIQHDFPPTHLRKLRQIPTLTVSPSANCVDSLALQVVRKLLDSDDSSDYDSDDY